MSKTTEHKEGKASVKAVYFTSKTLSDGSHPFMIRITKDRKLKYIATGLSLHPNYWNPKKKEVRRSYPEPDRENLLVRLEEWEKKYAEAAKTLSLADEQHDAPAVAKKAAEGRQAQRRIKLLAYIEELAAGMVVAGQVGNSTVYRDLGNQLAKHLASKAGIGEPPLGKGLEPQRIAWVQQHDIPFDQVTVAFCQQWEEALRGSGIEEITLSLRFRTLRAVLNKAIAAGVAKVEKYPFARNVAEKHKFQVGKFDVSTAKRAITRDDIRRLENLVVTTERHQLAKAVFAFSFYCGGINFVDLAQLRWQNLLPADGGLRLTYVRQKTGGKFSVKLLAPVEAIVEQYRAITQVSLTSYLLPILDATKHLTPSQVKNRLHKILGQVNADLKELGEKAGIATPLTTYVARHSFATTLRRSGANTAVISQAMGHKSEAVTAIYLDSFASEQVDAAFEGLL
ncbi:site-specific integrase [Hymenobacter tibetensis]|uniref:Site-specific integrase n=1 Tax=Hymenobacter tibetensis TaxID=497967 RepID=A0ABY4CVZ5_9BACT|nr:site-specific integrase [Hymenobacter tibetensis]UOG74353.1 site-specific integrase [Hymenobacter tibetensis]